MTPVFWNPRTLRELELALTLEVASGGLFKPMLLAIVGIHDQAT